MMMMMMMTMITMIMMMALLDTINSDVWTLPPPGHVFMESVDMRHVLKWRPLEAECNTTVLYSVQFQGEFELTILNDSWVNAPECQMTPYTQCDLTFDLGSDSDYNLRVKARCGSQTSPWTMLNRLFNRKNTSLTAPQMAVTAVGDALQVSFDKLPATAVVTVMVWKKGDELQDAVYMMPAEEKELHVAALQEGSEYCVRAQTVLDTHHHSSSTDTQCVSIRGSEDFLDSSGFQLRKRGRNVFLCLAAGPDEVGRRTITLTVTIIFVVGLLSSVFWSIFRCNPKACQKYFLKESLPHSLDSDWDIQIQSNRTEAELCEPVSVVQDKLLRLEY
ncbi:interleukin-20 receptor subunit beta [Antennarius striatus]|uniref:interleukin-20 receptor subunit beta n=1 Tax=Antennarius striatus TaxID=241820 RepID=UPI0035AF032D